MKSTRCAEDWDKADETSSVAAMRSHSTVLVSSSMECGGGTRLALESDKPRLKFRLLLLVQQLSLYPQAPVFSSLRWG